MTHLLFLLLLMAMISPTKAVVEFSNSTLIGAYDAVHYDIQLQKCSSGCHIYAAGWGGISDVYPNNTDKYMENVFIHDNIRNRDIITVSKLAEQVDSSRRKLPLTFQGPASIKIVDKNGPHDYTNGFVIYVVDMGTATSVDDYEVYDVADIAGVVLKPTTQIVSVLSAQPYTLTAPPSEESFQVTVRLAGFDNALEDNKDECEPAFETRHGLYGLNWPLNVVTGLVDYSGFPGFSVQPNTPILSLAVSESNMLILQSSASFEKNRKVTDDGFITSAGWNGCLNRNSGGIQTFRSPFYIPSDWYTLLPSANTDMDIHISVTPNFDSSHELSIQELNNKPIVIHGTKQVLFDVRLSERIDIWFEDMENTQGFLLRYTRDIPVLTTTISPAPSTFISKDNYCDCAIVDGFFYNWNPKEIWVDVVFVLDTSMGQSLEEAKAMVLSTVPLLSTDINAEFYSRVGVIAASETFDASIIYNLDMNSTDDLDSVKQHNIDHIDIEGAFLAASQMLQKGVVQPQYRQNARQIIYFLTNSPQTSNMADVDKFKEEGGIIVVNDFVGASRTPGLEQLASDNFYFMDLSNSVNSTQLLCEANCFCNTTKHAFNDDEKSPRTKANRGCFEAYNIWNSQSRASDNCQKTGGSLVSIHDSQKEFFVNSVASEFGPKEKYWLGIENNGTEWIWEDESTDSFSDWDINQPNTDGGQATCAYATQKSGLNVKWTAANCEMGGVIYVCESAPCSAGNISC